MAAYTARMQMQYVILIMQWGRATQEISTSIASALMP